MDDEVRKKSAGKRPVTHLPPSALHSILQQREETKDMNLVMTSRLCLPLLQRRVNILGIS